MKSLVLVPHQNENTFPDLRNLLGSALLISHYLCQKPPVLLETALICGLLAVLATLWPPAPLLDFDKDATHPSSFAALCMPPMLSQKPPEKQNSCLKSHVAFLHLWKCSKLFTNNNNNNNKVSFGPQSSHLGEVQCSGSMGSETPSP